MPSCLILTVVQLVNMCVIVFCSFVVPLSPFFLAVNTHPMPISQYLIEQAENLKSLWHHIIGLYCTQLVFKTRTKIRIFFDPIPYTTALRCKLLDVGKQIQWMLTNKYKKYDVIIMETNPSKIFTRQKMLLPNGQTFEVRSLPRVAKVNVFLMF